MAWFRMMGADSVEYHRRTVLGRGDDFEGMALAYYGSRGETPLQWGGRVAARLGLVGAVNDSDYEAVFGKGGARDPHLRTRLVDTKRPGVELVVAAHKSVAILGLLGKADDMHAILDAETDATLGFLEEWFARQGGRRGKAQHRAPTGGLLWARTRHLVSRSGDPNPHDHVLVANVSEMLDDRGGWKGLDTGGLRDLVHAATMVGRMAAAAEAVEMGYAIQADHGPSGKLDHWAIAGFPAAVTDLFSKRSNEIDDAMESTGFTSHRARGIAARATREAKRDDSPESLLLRWYDELDSIGWPTRKIHQRLRIVQDEHRRPLGHLGEGQRTEIVRSLIGPSGPLAERKAFTRPDVVRLAAPMLYGCATDELDRVVSGVVGHSEAIPLVGQPGARGRAWAAASALATEAAIAAVAERLVDRDKRAAVELAKVRAAIAAKEAALGRALTDDQRRAAEAIVTSGRGLDLVVGVAGSGKTTSLEVVRNAFEADGYRVLGTAISGQAARALHDEAGVESRTIASLVWRMEHGKLRLDDRTVLLIDEAGMTDDPAMLKLLAAVDAAGAKAVVIGDHRQLGAVGPGGGLEALVNRHAAVHLLGESVRQRDTGERRALEALRAGKVSDAVDWYQQNDRLRVVPSRHDAVDAAVNAWHADVRAGNETVLLAWRRVDVAALNESARERCVSVGSVTGRELEAPGGRRYAAGDRVVTLAPSGDGRFVTSERASVVRVAGEALEIRFTDGRSDVLSGEELGKDRLDHAYAVTIHRMQGATVDRAHVLADGGGRELAYVAMSRTRGSTQLYVVADDTEQAVDDLTREWSTERRQRWVLDTDAVAEDGADRRPSLHPGASAAVRAARLRAEREALQAVAPEETGRLAALDMQLRLERLVSATPAPTRGIGLAR